MRLIEADALIEKLEAWKKEAKRIGANINYIFASAIIAQVNAEPTIEERKKGEWIPVTNGRGGFECDQCHNYAPSYQDGVEWLSGFCPNCGADMRGEKDG